MFNKTEMLQIKWGRNDRWRGHVGTGFTSGSRGKGRFQYRQGKAVKGGKLISASNRRAAMRAARRVDKYLNS